MDTDSSLLLLLNITATEINNFGAEWRTDLALGENRKVDTEFYQPLFRHSRLFAAVRGIYQDEKQNAFRDGTLAAEYDVERETAIADLGLRLDTFGELRAGLYAGVVKADAGIGEQGLQSFDDEEGGAQGSLVIDKLDSGNFPRKGYYLNVSGRMSREDLGSSVEDYDRLESSLRLYGSLGNHTFMAGMHHGTSLDTDLPAYDEFTLGGFGTLAGYPRERFRGDYMAAGRLGYFYRLGMLSPSMGKGIYIGGVFDAGNTWDDADAMDFDDLHEGGGLLFALDTVFGPVYLAYGRGEENSDQYLISLGNRF